MTVFPASVVDHSILVAVIIGVLIAWGFKETLGWNFTGLVVPGYLAAVFSLEPAAGLVIATEAILTWLIVLPLASKAVPTHRWTPLFGRDRFFAILVISIAVRLGLEAALFPWLATVTHAPGLHALHSVGLVIVPLTANALWRTGPARAINEMGVPAVLTWLLLQVLLLGTNLTLGRPQLLWEDLALDFESKPRAYVCLLLGAWLGSLANQRWGWDFGGIVVPGLLAVLWATPDRLAATFVEVFVIAGLMTALLSTRWLKGANLTGGRPLVMALVVAYVTKFTFGWLLGASWLGLGIRDLFGFGYLLPSLMALRILRSGHAARTLIPSVLLSGSAFVLATVFGALVAIGVPSTSSPERVRPGPDVSWVALVSAAYSSSNGDFPTMGVERVVTVESGAVAWLGGEGPLVMAELTDYASGLRALRVGRALGASAVYVCRVQACEVRDEPTLVVQSGPTDLLHGWAALSDTGALTVLSSRMDALHLGDAAGDMRLVIGPGSFFDAGPSAGLARSDAPLSSRDLALIGPVFAPAMFQARRGDLGARVVLDELAAELHLSISYPPESVRLEGRQLDLIWRGGQGPLVISGFASSQPYVEFANAAIAEALDASVVIVGWPDLDPATRVVAGRAFARAVLAASPDVSDVVQVRMLRDSTDAGVDAVSTLR